MTTALVAAIAALLLAAYTPATPETTTAADCPAPTVTVATMAELQAAVDAAQPGDVVVMEPGRYDGNLTIERSGAKSNPIWLCGPRDAVIDGGTVRSGRVVRLADADHWRLVGFTVTNGLKGIIVSAVNGAVLSDLHVHHIGHEAIHLLSGSTDSVVRDSEIHDTGLVTEMFGEGVYVGTARDNWGTRGVD